VIFRQRMIYSVRDFVLLCRWFKKAPLLLYTQADHRKNYNSQIDVPGADAPQPS
jgi:hypothetical protein